MNKKSSSFFTRRRCCIGCTLNVPNTLMAPLSCNIYVRIATTLFICTLSKKYNLTLCRWFIGIYNVTMAYSYFKVHVKSANLLISFFLSFDFGAMWDEIQFRDFKILILTIYLGQACRPLWFQYYLACKKKIEGHNHSNLTFVAIQ